MNFKTPTQKDVTQTGTMVAGGVVGALVGRGITAVIAKPAASVPTESEKTKKLVVHIVMAVAGIAGGAALKGTDTTTDLTKGALLGIGVDNTISVISHFTSNSEKLATKLAADTPMNRFAKSALALNCPSCEQNDNARQVFMRSIPSMNGPRYNKRRLNAPSVITDSPTFVPLNADAVEIPSA